MEAVREESLPLSPTEGLTLYEVVFKPIELIFVEKEFVLVSLELFDRSFQLR